MTRDILLVDDDPSSIRVMARVLDGLRPLRFATGGDEALRLAHETPPDLILLDAEMPDMSGFEVCETLKADPALAEVPVIFVTSHGDTDFEVAGFGIGAADFITKPVSPPLVLARVKAQLRFKQMADELRRISTVDALTGVANRRCFDDALAREWRRAGRGGEPLALLMIDVDHFKLFNDVYGHPAGDACLHAVAQALKSATQRPADLVARYGGEEFVLLLPGTPRAGAEHIAHRVLDAVEALAIPHRASPTAHHVTVSLGLACYDETSASWVQHSPHSRFQDELQGCSKVSDLAKAADLALYAAKRAGRAQGRLLDVADVDAPALARDLTPPLRARRRGLRMNGFVAWQVAAAWRRLLQRRRSALWGLLLAAATAAKAAPPVLTLAVADLPFATTALIAEAQGWFAAEGLSLKIVHCPVGRVCLEQLLSGQAHLATVADTPIVFASFVRKDFTVVATLASSGRDYRMVVRTDRGITTAADLKGRRIGVLNGTSMHYFAETFLRFHGLDPADVRLVAIDAGDLTGALVRGEVDATALFDPHVGEALRQLGAKGHALPVLGFFNVTYNLVSAPAAAGASDEELVKLLRVLKRADDLVRRQPERARSILAAALKLEPESLEHIWSHYDFRLQLAPTLISSLEAQSRWALREKLAPAGASLPDYAAFIRSGPLRRVDPRAIRLLE